MVRKQVDWITCCGLTLCALHGIGAAFGDELCDSHALMQWVQQFGTQSDDFANAVAVHSSGCVIVTGTTGGSFGDKNAGILDVFLAKYHADGTFAWARQFGTTAEDHGVGVAVDLAGDVYVVGSTGGSLADTQRMGGTASAFVARYNADGDKLWIRQFGTDDHDSAASVAVDSVGNVYIAGDTGQHPHQPNPGWDTFLTKYSLGRRSIVVRPVWHARR